MKFTLSHTDSKSNARAGVIQTDHGDIQTPIFMPVGTIGSVKAINQEQLKNEINAQIILGNTYHLYLRPGTEVIKESGGLHRFINWDRPILTDSGGYQVYSLAEKRKLTEEGAKFQSHIDGSRHLFTPENIMDIQRVIGADIIMAFDECPPYPSTFEYARKSMGLTHRWLDRCVDRFRNTEALYGYQQELFPILQGSTFADLRKESAEYIAHKDCFGNAIGGLSVGEPHDVMYELTDLVCSILPKEKPRYLMGVGTPENILECIALGVDMFDCVMPTRNGRNGTIFTKEGMINIKNKKWEKDFSPLDDEHLPNYSKAYIRHLFMAGEMLGPQLASLQNLSFYLWLVNQAREHIIQNTFASWKNEMVQKLKQKR